MGVGDWAKKTGVAGCGLARGVFFAGWVARGMEGGTGLVTRRSSPGWTKIGRKDSISGTTSLGLVSERG